MTFAQWDACVADGGCTHKPDDSGWGRGSRPVIDVSWDDAQTYIAWLNRKTGQRFRLPTEAEWEYAARAGTTTRYSWGDDEGQACQYANGFDQAGKASHLYYLGWEHFLCSDGEVNTAPVGRYAANAFGLHDMHGNVWEWTADCGNGNYNGAPSDGSAWQSGDCGRRVWRGGSWLDDPGLLRSSCRLRFPSGKREYNLGFRLVQDRP